VNTGMSEQGGRPGLTRRSLFQVGAATAATLGVGSLASACSDTGTPSSTPAGKPKYGGVLRVGLPQGGTTDTIDAAKGALLPDYARRRNLYDSLVRLNPQTGEIENTLAEEITPNRDATEWTIRLRDGVEFHNGKTLEAEDLAFTLQRAFDPAIASPDAAQLKFLDPNSIKVIDKRTVRVGMLRPYLLPYSFHEGVALTPVGYDPQNPVGTGPFKFKSFTPGERSVFTAHDNYWQGRPFADELELIDLTDDTARLNAQLGGQTDLMVSVPYGNAQTLATTGGQTLVETPNDGYSPFAMNCAVPPFDDPRVRQAMRLLADRQAIIDSAFAGYGRIGNDLYAPSDPHFDSSIEQRVQDVDQAKFLLKQAGHEDTTFTFSAVPLVAGSFEAAQVFAQTAKSAGVNIKVEQVDVETYINGYGTWPMVNSQWPYLPWITCLMASDGPGAAYPETQFGDVDQEFAGLFDQVVGELDDAKRTQVAADMQQIEHERGGYLIHSFTTLVDAASTRVTGYATENQVGWDFGSFEFRTVSFV
jgi:peptide/nickel transport system substrate-binding protein